MSRFGQFLRFCCVGVGASLTHLFLVAMVVPIGMNPLVANAAGFLVAYHVSYFGHCLWTFRGSSGVREYRRLWVVALSTFGCNQILYAAVLKWTRLDYRLGLVGVLFLVAVLTFVVARLWVFGGERTVEVVER